MIPLLEVGKAPDTAPLFRGHKGPVLDTVFNPFNKQQVVSCSEDGVILVWNIPEDFSFRSYVDENDNVKDITEPYKVLKGHTRKVGHVDFHPCAENVLASCSLDYTVKIWNIETGKAEITLPHKDLVTSFAFNYNGTLMATTSRDKKLRIWDLRTQEVISEGPGHTGAKPSRVVWLGNTDRICTTGFSRLSDRQVGIWDVKDISKGPIDGFLVIDSSSGVLIPVFDELNSILYLAGKGDGNIRYYEYDTDELFELSQYSSTDAQRGFAVAPKIAVNLKENEILKSFKTVNDHSIEPISFIVPRKSDLFQLDIYPDAPGDKPALSASEWFGGKDVNGPLLVNLEAIYDGTEPESKEAPPAVSVSEIKKEKELTPAPTPKAASHSTPAPEPQTPTKAVEPEEDSSAKVDNLLNKVVDESDDEDSKRIEESGEDWEEVKKEDVQPSPESTEKEIATTETEEEAPKEEIKKEVIKEVKKEEVKKEEPATVALKEEPAAVAAAAKVEPEVTPAAESKEVKKGDAQPAANTNQPTLRATVDRLAKLVESLELHVSTLVEAGLEKDTRLKALEEKLEALIQK